MSATESNWTTYTYDRLNRVMKIESPDGVRTFTIAERIAQARIDKAKPDGGELRAELVNPPDIPQE